MGEQEWSSDGAATSGVLRTLRCREAKRNGCGTCTGDAAH
jgi:hypothetical protein